MDYIAEVETVKALKREGHIVEAEALLKKMLRAMETDAQNGKGGGRGGHGVAPWYYEQLAVIYRKAGDLESERLVLERFAAMPHAPGAMPPKLLERLRRVKELARRLAT